MNNSGHGELTLTVGRTEQKQGMVQSDIAPLMSGLAFFLSVFLHVLF